MKTLNFTKRNYSIQISESGYLSTQSITIEMLLNINDNMDDYEFIYALQEIADDVLDLKINESLYFKPNRDNELAKGIITRVK